MATRTSSAGPKRPQRTGKSLQSTQEPPLSLERIVQAAVELMDAGGLDGLTMRRLADHLGSGVMSLYWHVDSKEDVLDLALDSVLEYQGPTSASRSREDWRGDVIRMLEDWRACMLRHPWSAALLPRRALGANILARLELLSRTLSRAGIADEDLNAAIWSIWNHVMGATVTLANFDRSDDARKAATQRRPEGTGGDYPTIEGSRLLLDEDWDGAFRKGLGFLLDGLPLKKVD
ncbi:TetR/AcrR family transcriptional regulator [Stappia sp. MMSF_3263]|uniref:TetR/AcrR family transcriptional regulator n=1 Tax=Stappia sp. MMSF_3263 TaxID=3046693 RepID=UPI00273F8D7A|nr:TetR/AcrR family transcriptional regulator C-terminal domain-containing protein [Stappia sp. MMSF_3263]